MEKKVAYIGVDPGKKGFLTIFKPEISEYFFYTMPTHKVETGEFTAKGKPKLKSEFHIEGVRDLIFQIAKDFKGYRFIAAIEDVHGREGWSAQNNFTFGHTTGLQRMILVMLNAETELVRPQKWQSIIYNGYEMIKTPSSTGKTMVNDAKAMSEMVATSEFPNIDFRKNPLRKKTARDRNDDNKIDSFLICQYLLRKHYYPPF